MAEPPVGGPDELPEYLHLGERADPFGVAPRLVFQAGGAEYSDLRQFGLIIRYIDFVWADVAQLDSYRRFSDTIPSRRQVERPQISSLVMNSPAVIELAGDFAVQAGLVAATVSTTGGAWWLFRQALNDPEFARRIPDLLNSWEEGWHDLQKNRRRRALERANSARRARAAQTPELDEQISAISQLYAPSEIDTSAGDTLAPVDVTTERLQRDLYRMHSMAGPIIELGSEGIPNDPPWTLPR